MVELAAIATGDEAAVWARRTLPAKNTLTPEDADVIEQAFRAKMRIHGTDGDYQCRLNRGQRRST